MSKVIHIGVASFLTYMTFISKPGTTLFSLHPFCMALAYGGLMTEAVLVFTSSGLWSAKSHGRASLFYWHWVLNALAGVTAVAGLTAIYLNKDLMGKEHFVTYHGVLGVTCVCYTLVQLGAGLFLKYPSRLPEWASLKTLKKAHAVSGISAYLLALLTMGLAFKSTWFLSASLVPLVEVLFVALYGAVFVFLFGAVRANRLGLRLFS